MPTTTLLRRASAAHQPTWPSLNELRAVLDDVAARPALVSSADCATLKSRLAEASRGNAFVLQVGDCAERFADSGPASTHSKATQLDGLAQLVTATAHTPSVLIGRIAGQYAKPRSRPTELAADGTEVPSYFGDAVNDVAATISARTPDPRRLRHAYEHAAAVLRELDARAKAGMARVFSSHEALILEYEEALVRTGPTQTCYGASGHLLWIGERTRQLDHEHVAFMQKIENPVAVKIGPAATPSDVRGLVSALNPHAEPGRLTLITRLGAKGAAKQLSRLLTELGPSVSASVAWICDPMHGNTVVAECGRKTRIVEDVEEELDQTAEVLSRFGLPMAGLHLETSPDSITECVTRAEIASCELPRYHSACDPRLSPDQAASIVAFAARRL